MNLCQNCGTDCGGGENEIRPSNCRNCPPTRCEDCGGMCEWHEGGQLCSCWTDIRDMPLADIKALFAASDDVLSIDLAE